MNVITITGGKKKQRELTKDVVDYCIRRLMPRTKSLRIDIELSKMSDLDGACLSNTHRDFEIELSSTLGQYDFITTICHEMVHVKQYAAKQLVDKHGAMKNWKTKMYNENRTKYMNLPWEKEAYHLQDVLYEEYIAYDVPEINRPIKNLFVL